MAHKTYLKPEEIQKLIDQAGNLRDQLILSFLMDTGCRVSELLGLKVGDIDLEKRTALIMHLKSRGTRVCLCGYHAGKRAVHCTQCGRSLKDTLQLHTYNPRQRLISYGGGTAELLAKYMDGIEEKKPLFPITRQTVNNRIKKIAEKINLDGKIILNPDSGKMHQVSPHKLRDALAVSWLNFAGGDITKQKALQAHLGHQSFATTMRYFKIAPTEVQDVSDQVRHFRFGTKDEKK